MSRSFRPRLPALAVFAGLLASAGATLAQDPPAPAAEEPPARARVKATGFDAFRGLAKRAGFKPLGGTDELLRDPGHTVLIVLGGNGPMNPEWLRFQYLERGGVVLFATDRELVNGGSWYRMMGYTITGERVKTFESSDQYLRLPDCPIVTPARGSPPIFADLNRVATNVPSYVYTEFPVGSKVLAWFPESCEVMTDRGPWSPPGRLPFAMTRQVGGGRLLVMADHSLFINSMMMGENDNFVLAERTLDWLAGPEKRSGCLLYEDNRIVTDFDVAWLEGPPPNLKEIAEMLKDNWPAAIPLINAVAQEAQKPGGPVEDLQGRGSLVNRALRALLPRHVLGPALAIVVTAALILLGLGRATSARQRTDTEVAPAGPVPEAKPDDTPLRRRLAAQAERGDWYEVAREQVRERFRALGLLDADADRPPVVAAAEAGWLRRRKLRRQVLELWRIGFGRDPETVPAGRWRELLARLDALEQAAVAGVWRFEPTREGA